MSIAAIITEGIGPGSSIKYALTLGYNIGGAVAAVTPGKVKKRWRELPNGIRVYGTEQGFQALLNRALLARTEAIEEAAPEPIAVELREPEKAPDQPVVKEVALPVEAKPLLGEPPIPSIELHQADDSRMASIVAAAVLRQREIAAENERLLAEAKAAAERAEAEAAERQRLIEVDNEETAAVLRALGIDLHDWPTMTAEAENEEAILERLIMELLS